MVSEQGFKGHWSCSLTCQPNTFTPWKDIGLVVSPINSIHLPPLWYKNLFNGNIYIKEDLL